MSPRGGNSTWDGVISAALSVALLACPGVPLPFEGRWTGTLVRSFECADMGGAISDVAVDWAVTRAEDSLSIATSEQDCPTLTASMLPGAEDEARLDVAHCSTTRPEVPDGGPIREPTVNTRTWTDGRLRLRQGGGEMLVDMWEHDEGSTGSLDAGTPYICDGLSFGALLLEE